MSLVRFRLWAPFAGLAHLVERHLAKVEVASSSLVARSKKEAPPIGWCFFFGAGKFASQTYPAGELKSRGNPTKVSPANIPFLADNRKCYIFFVNAKQKETGHPNGCPVSFWTVIKKCELAVSTRALVSRYLQTAKYRLKTAGNRTMLDTGTKHQTAAGNFCGPFRVRDRRIV